MLIITEPRSVPARGLPDEAAITLDRVDFFQGSTEPHMLEITFAHTVPDTVPGDSDTARYNAVFDRVDARGLSIADAIASLTADTLASTGLDY